MNLVCAVKIERPYGSDKWEHCPEPVTCRFVDREEDIPLCARCARNVRHGDYGARLRDLLNEQVPEQRSILERK